MDKDGMWWDTDSGDCLQSSQRDTLLCYAGAASLIFAHRPQRHRAMRVDACSGVPNLSRRVILSYAHHREQPGRSAHRPGTALDKTVRVDAISGAWSITRWGVTFMQSLLVFQP
jgi:hypothetical protein